MDSFIGVTFESPTIGTVIAMVTALFLLMMSAFVSASEIAFFSMSPEDIRVIKRGEFNADRKVDNLMGDSERLLATILIANNLVNVAIILLLDLSFSQIIDFGTAKWLEFVVLTVLLTFVLLLFGEIIPKLYASHNSLSYVRKASPVLAIFVVVLKPLSSLLMKSNVLADKLVKKKKYNISVDELEHALELTDSEDIHEEQEMLEGVIRFGDETVVDIMTSRLDMVMLDIKSSFADVMKCIAENIYSRVPVYSGTSDNIKGVLYIKDLIPYLEKGDNFRWQSLIRPAFFVPESKKIDDLLHDFQTGRIHIAIVVDEFGGTSGLVTLEDVIEEILGEINDEFDEDDSLFIELDENRFVFDGKIPLSEFFKVVDLDEQDYLDDMGEADTLAGWLLEMKGDFPRKGEELKCREIAFKVIEKKDRRIARIQVEIKKK